MATNQVIHGSNRVVENPNRYKLNAVSGQANTYDLEKVPGVITDNGTPYSKAILDKIDNVLSYLTPNVQKVETQVEKRESIHYSGMNKCASIDTATSRQVWFKEINATYTNMGTLNVVTPSLKIHSNNTNGIYIDNYNATQRPNMYASFDGTPQYTQYYFKEALNTEYFVNGYGLVVYTNSSYYVLLDFDLKMQANFYIDSYINNPTSNCIVELYCSNDNETWTFIQTLRHDRNQINITNYRYIRLKVSKGTGSGDNCTIGTFAIKDISGQYIYSDTAYENQFTLDNNGTEFVNNQRVLLEPPSITDTTGVSTNTLNGFNIQTLLQPDTKYELVYKEDTNKFELGGLKTLFDITLEQAVNQVDLTGIVDMLEIGKIYCIYLTGSTNTSSRIEFGSGYFTYGTTSIIYSPFIFSIYKSGNTTNWTGLQLHTSSSYAIASSGTLNNYEFMKCSGANDKFNAGTRIIIKEVA